MPPEANYSFSFPAVIWVAVFLQTSPFSKAIMLS